MLSKFEGIVFRAKDYGESNQIVLVFTEQFGKISLMARGSKKPKSRFRAVTEPFTLAQFICFTGSGMPTLSQADLIKPRHLLRSDLLLTAYGAYWFELIDKLLSEKEPHSLVYRLLDHGLDHLEKGTDPDVLTRIIELNMLGVAGYQPVLDRCVQCSATTDLTHFSIRQGGFLCKKCRSVDGHAFSLQPAVVRILPLLQRIELRRLGEVSVKPETNQQLESVLSAFIDEYLSGPWKSRQILQQFKQTWR